MPLMIIFKPFAESRGKSRFFPAYIKMCNITDTKGSEYGYTLFPFLRGEGGDGSGESAEMLEEHVGRKAG